MAFASFDVGPRSSAGTRPAMRTRMAAVFALVFLFVFASIGLLGKVVIGDPSVMSVSALATFVALASGVFVGCFKLARDWEGPPGH